MKFDKAFEEVLRGKIIHSKKLNVTLAKHIFNGDDMIVKIIDGCLRGIISEEFILKYPSVNDWEIVDD